MKILAMSDLHGHKIRITKCNVLAIAGDISKMGEIKWFNEQFVPYLDSYKNKFDTCMLVFGNHDDKLQFGIDKLEVPEYMHILNSKGFNYKGYIFWGSPWVPRSEEIITTMNTVSEKTMRKIFRDMNPNTDVLITHSPPHGIGDTVITQNYSLGSTALMDRVRVVRPKIHIFGHIHTGKKYTEYNGTKFYNVSVLNEWYEEAFKPTIINL